MIGKREAAAIALLGCVALAGCAQSKTGSGTRSGDSPAASSTSSASSPASSPSSPASPPVTTTATELAARMQDGNRTISSAVGSLNLTAGPVTEQAAYTVEAANGVTNAMDMTFNVESNANTVKVRMLWADRQLYLQSGAFPVPAGKTWLHASESSANAQIANMAKSFQGTASQTSAQQYAAFVSAAKDVKVVGREVLDGVPTTHYRLSVDLSRAIQHVAEAQKETFQRALDAGLTEFPLELWVDSQYRTRMVTELLTVAGQQIKMELRMGKFNEPVTIQAPPADQVTEG